MSASSTYVNANGVTQTAPGTWDRERIIHAIQEWAASHGGTPPSKRDWNSGGKGHPDRRVGVHPATETVVGHFGSWSAGLHAAGFTPRAPGRPSSSDGAGSTLDAVLARHGAKLRARLAQIDDRIVSLRVERGDVESELERIEAILGGAA